MTEYTDDVAFVVFLAYSLVRHDGGCSRVAQEPCVDGEQIQKEMRCLMA
jgi:hypothetical protein